MNSFIAIIVCVVIGPICLWKGTSDLIKGSRSKSWPTTEGRIISTKLSESRGRWGTRFYAPMIKYEYEVGEDTYTCDRLNLGDRSSTSTRETAAVFARYPEGRKVTVHYNPKAPKEALLEVGSKGVNWILVLVGAGMTVGGVFAARAKWKKLMDPHIAPTSGF